MATFYASGRGEGNREQAGGMRTKPVALEFTAVVIFRIGGKSMNVKGFSHPRAIPTNYPDAIARIEDHIKSIQGLIESGDLGKVHSVADKISDVCKKLPELADKDHRTIVQKLSTATIALFKKIDDAADNGRKGDTIEVLKLYKANVAALKKHLKSHGHGH